MPFSSLVSALIVFRMIYGMENNIIDPDLLKDLKRKRDDFELLQCCLDSAFEENKETIDNDSWNEFSVSKWITEEERFSVALYFAHRWTHASYGNEPAGKKIMERIHIAHKKFRRADIFSTTVFTKLKNDGYIEQIVMKYLNLDDYRLLRLFYPKVMRKVHTNLEKSYDDLYGIFRYANGFYFRQDQSWTVYDRNAKIDMDATINLHHFLVRSLNLLDKRDARAIFNMIHGACILGQERYLEFQEVIEKILFTDKFAEKFNLDNPTLFLGFFTMLNQGLCNDYRDAASLLRRAVSKPRFLKAVLESIRKRGLRLTEMCEDIEVELLLNVNAKGTWDCLHEDEIEYLVFKVYKSCDRCFYSDGNKGDLSRASYKQMKASRFETLLEDGKISSLYPNETLQELRKYRNDNENNWDLVQNLITQNMKQKILKN